MALKIEGMPALKKDAVKKAKKVRYASKTGINLGRNEAQEKSAKQGAILGVLVIAVLACIVKFGVIDMQRELSDAIAGYDDLTMQNLTLQAAIADYGAVQIEYRTYATDWTANDADSGDYISVTRQKVLDLIETEVMPRGTVKNIQITGDSAILSMSGMTLDGVSDMMNDLLTRPMVANVSMNNAVTEEREISYEEENEDGELELVTVMDASTISFTLTISLQAEDAGVQEVAE